MPVSQWMEYSVADPLPGQVLIIPAGWIYGDGVYAQKNPESVIWRIGVLFVKSAATYSPTFCSAVPSAQEGLTSLFGMGRGGTPPLKPPEDFKYRDMLV